MSISVAEYVFEELDPREAKKVEYKRGIILVEDKETKEIAVITATFLRVRIMRCLSGSLGGVFTSRYRNKTATDHVTIYLSTIPKTLQSVDLHSEKQRLTKLLADRIARKTTKPRVSKTYSVISMTHRETGLYMLVVSSKEKINLEAKISQIKTYGKAGWRIENIPLRLFAIAHPNIKPDDFIIRTQKTGIVNLPTAKDVAREVAMSIGTHKLLSARIVKTDDWELYHQLAT